MTNANNSSNASLTVEETKKMTIEGGANSKDGNGEIIKAKSVISPATEKEILDEIKSHCENWNKIAFVYIGFIIIFGLSAVCTSVLVSIYTGEEKLMSVPVIKVLAGISTISLAVLTAFNLVGNGNNARNAWRSLNAALLLYKAGSLSLEQLIEQYQKGENQIGSFNFNYGPNADKPGTYTQDVAEHDEIKKQKQNEADKVINQALENDKKDGIKDEKKDTKAPEKSKDTSAIMKGTNGIEDKHSETNES